MSTLTPPQTDPERAATLFPKISGKPREFFENIHYIQKHSLDFPKHATHIPLVGTVKLHCTHNDIVIHADGNLMKIMPTSPTPKSVSTMYLEGAGSSALYCWTVGKI